MLDENSASSHVLTGVFSLRHCIHRESFPSSPLHLPPQWLQILKLNASPPAMTTLLSRVARTRWLIHNAPRARRMVMVSEGLTSRNRFSTCCYLFQRAKKEKHTDGDPRINVLGRAIEDDFATIRENYGLPPLFCEENGADENSYAQTPNCPRTRSPRLR